MTEEYVLLIFLLGHISLGLVLVVLMQLSILHLSKRDFLLTLFVPLWGGVMALLAAVYTKKKKAGDKERDLPKLEDLTSSLVQRPILPEESSLNEVIPLEEALVLEDPAVRRHLILEIVQEDPEHYISLLKKVRLGEDTEVSHYASTAIMQVQRAYETELKSKEKLMKQFKTNEAVVQDYLNTMNEYIETGLLADNALKAQRKKVNTIYVSLLAENVGGKDLYRDAIDNLIELNEYTAAQSLLLDAKKQWSKDEEFVLLKLKLSHRTKDRYAMRKEIQSVKESGMYVSPETREVIDFWRNQG